MLFGWWRQNRRDFPWRKTTDPYRIMVSEFMLQQTQVSRVVPKYLSFLDKFPSVEALASSELKDVLAEWIGLGYNRRAKWLREAAQQIVEIGEFPQSPEELMCLKGIGPYTSRSILIFAFNSDFAAVDTNVRNVFLMHGFIESDWPLSRVQSVADQLLPLGRSRDYHNALMDYGSAHRTRRRSAKPSDKPFELTDRYYRGAILRHLLNGSMNAVELAGVIGVSEGKLTKLIDDLIDEGFILRNDNMYGLA